MTPDEFIKLLRANADRLRSAYADRWPRMMRSLAINHFREGFRQGGFIGDNGLERWNTTRRQSVPFNGRAGSLRPLNSVSGSLMRSIDGRTQPGEVVIFSTSDHARYHNEGAEATVTPRMKRFFWAKHAEAKKRYGAVNAETLFWQNMALTKKQKIRIPQRVFMRGSAQLMKEIYSTVSEDLKRILGAK